MARINLLPWRAERRKQREREFYTHLGLAFAAGIAIVIVWGMWMNMRISNQNERNTYLTGQIHQLDQRIAQIKNLEKVRDHLLARKRIIEKLQADRSKMVHLFDELVKTIPSSVRLTSLQQQGDQLKLKGVAQSNASVAEYMRNLEKSPWMSQVELGRTDNTGADTRMPYVFNLSMKMVKPKSEDSSDSQADASPKGGAMKGGAKK
ncbi:MULTISPECIES: PilN domain-containing protein [Oleiagrimonas]|jgi:type IV pilus assembly protein PilN|uniref:PilN domain-containing protein n=1 Tax=Oleiagrimonas citrea TaxID=1665687 RepID=A0A846ZM65_9GAMM|nr:MULTISPECIES: PilN domain-containing protein [Oleiagrimonas]NKZ39405.1 PilN domain-containing protein [Oleiagrimonas citrea]RAP59612.1 fimbrial assembly protein [Oleiagrimonas sp. MCCC 1A03011]